MRRKRLTLKRVDKIMMKKMSMKITKKKRDIMVNKKSNAISNKYIYKDLYI